MKEVLKYFGMYLAILLVIVSFFTGCTVKERIVYKPVKFDSQKINMKGATIDMGSKPLQRLCAPKMNELNTMWFGVKAFYDDQIDREDDAKKRALEILNKGK